MEDSYARLPVLSPLKVGAAGLISPKILWLSKFAPPLFSPVEQEP